MSISGSLSNAFAGLTAAARGVEVVSQNLANVQTEGYARRELELSTRHLGGAGGGVRIEGVRRHVDGALLASRRLADAVEARDRGIGGFLSRIEAAVGTPGEPGALGTRLAEFEAALVAAASRPDTAPRLEAAVEAARALAAGFGAITRTLQEERMAADAGVAAEVGRLNAALARIVELNHDIRVERASGRDPSGLMDERQRLIDTVSAIVPVREVAREGGQVALITTGGAVLLDGPAAEIGFTPTATITADMTLASGALSGLTFRGQPATAGTASGLLGGDSLGALMAIRDELAPAAQARLDALARDLVERFEGADTTLPAGAAGLFTDRGAAFSAADETGLAGRLVVNAAVDPAQGGALWRLRDGIGAAAPGPVGEAGRLHDLIGALSAPRVPASGGFAGGARTAQGLAGEFLTSIGTARQRAEGDLAYSSGRREALRAAELATGVDSDQELQQLLVIEKAYAANARVISAAEAMLDRLMEI
ncbi:MAG: flagellar hook-associated protein FlgK [Rhodobacteraceae bacterium]|nr:flagellar hook-associated protein FlgK [Paracoccaceae bacterium]